MAKAEKKFAEAMAAFGKRLGKLNASDSNVQALTALLPQLLPTSVVNEVEGAVYGDVVQAGSQLGGVWGAAGTLVGGLGDRALSQDFIAAAAAAAACAPGVRNTVKGAVYGDVVQTGNSDVQINIGKHWRQ